MDENFEDIKILSLADGLSVKIEDEDEVFISLLDQGKCVHREVIPWPGSGYGGSSLVLSPSQKYLVFNYYSGQSEEAFKLYSVTNELKELFDSGYHFGETASFCFDSSEENLIMAFPYSCCEWWYPVEEGDIETSESGVNYLSFGEIRTLSIRDNTFTTHEIRVAICSNIKIVEAEYNPLLSPVVKGDDLELNMPWGSVKFPLPLVDHVMIHAPNGI